MTKIQIFQFSQFALLFLIAVTILLFSRSSHKNKNQFGVTEADLWERKKKDLLSKAKPEPSQLGSAGIKSGPALGATFPTWNESTPAHDILGVSAQAPLEVIEAAYKTLLKKYHPDRYQSWGADYVDRAHIVIFKLQQARDEMLKKRV